MGEALGLDDPFRHASTRDLFAPLVAFFYAATLAGRQNSVVLQEQARGGPHRAATTSLGPEQRRYDEFSTACREAVNFARQLGTGQFEAPSPELLALAKQVAERQAARKKEDVEAWAERLAQDAGGATD